MRINTPGYFLSNFLGSAIRGPDLPKTFHTQTGRARIKTVKILTGNAPEKVDRLIFDICVKSLLHFRTSLLPYTKIVNALMPHLSHSEDIRTYLRCRRSSPSRPSRT